MFTMASPNADALADLGGHEELGQMFAGFQRYRY